MLRPRASCAAARRHAGAWALSGSERRRGRRKGLPHSPHRATSTESSVMGASVRCRHGGQERGLIRYVARNMALAADEELILRQLLDLLDRTVGPWAAAVENDGNYHVHDGSEMAADDAATDPYHLSHSAWHALSVSVDHLRCLRASLVCETGDTTANIRIFTNAQGALVRGVIENAARAVWMLGPEDSVVRVVHRLRLEGGEIKPSLRMHELVRKKPNRTLEQRQQRLRGIATAARVPADQIRELTKRPEYSQIVRGAGELIDFDPDLAEFVWKACSSLAHGDIAGTVSLADREVVARIRGINMVKVTGSISLLYWCTSAAIVMASAAFRLYDLRATTPVAGVMMPGS